MCFGGGGGSTKVIQDHTVSRKQAALAQQLDDDYVARFLPVERELLNYAENKGQITAEAEAAKQTAGKVFDSGNGTVERSLAGFGASLTPQQKAAYDQMQHMNRNGAQIVAANMAREATDARLDKLGTNLMNLGRGAQGAGLSGMNTAAGLEGQRNQAAIQQAAQQQAAGYSALGTGIGIIGSIAMGM
ncbi:hypothetical protein GZ77_23380 [Endozoicomonas montiporae]|uniref:Uncharacterized protein n=2 Tax=Endozoicomonas montiporae TaxID=1027273 RepID=A0A081N0Q7_9GAMM|nr:hypothetical protein [Endozoicomonas montiporae]AMO54507.1 hypothetical protein EZMO1_0242 [Endozoicomonas montiporae CL-33]KEQ12030.1 hypothetical protein GZ77_23380 [Endozoicomonas montiporae]